jgi:alpha-methylacyl-CoA racemase
MAVTARPGPLASVKVLDLSRMFPGAFCTLLLADLGADVLKVEAPGAGDGMRTMAAPGEFNAAHVALNRGKRSLMLDLRHPEAAGVLTRLVRWADIVIESHKPGQLDRLGLGYELMSAENPKIVWCSITGFGDTGPNADMPGHDITYLGYAGLLSRLSAGATTPPAAPISLPLGALMSAVGVLAGLSEAARTGKGVRLDANMCDAAMWTLSEDVARAARHPAPGWGSFVSRNVYPCADGREVTVAATEPRTWAALCAALDLPELAGHQLGVDEDDAATARVAERLRTKPAAEWVADPGMGGGVAPVNDVADLLDDPQVTGRGSLVTLPGTGDRVLANPIRFAGASGDDASHGLAEAPALGAHTDDALRTAGFTDTEIDALRGARVVG